MYEMTITTENAKGKLKIEKITCHGADAVSQERANRRSLAPKGSTQTISVRKI